MDGSVLAFLNCTDGSVLAFLNCTDGSVLAFLNCTDGSILAFLNCMDGSVLTHLNGSYGSVLSHLRFPNQSGLTRFPQSGSSLVPWLLCKKSNKKMCLKYNVGTAPTGHSRCPNLLTSFWPKLSGVSCSMQMSSNVALIVLECLSHLVGLVFQLSALLSCDGVM